MRNNSSFCSVFLCSVVGLFPHIVSAGSDSLLLTITGEVVSQPCVVKPDDENVAIDVSTITDADLARDKRTKSKNFQIHLEKCNADVAKGVKVTFSGTAVPTDNTLLALAANSEAKGIAIGLEEQDGTVLPINKASRTIAISNGETTLDFGVFVKLISLSDLKPGKFGATANFKLDYE